MNLSVRLRCLPDKYWMVISTNPNVTRGSSAGTESVLRFPLTEDLSIGTRLRFCSYNRFTPGEEPIENQTALISLPLPMSIADSSNIKTTMTDLGPVIGMMDPSLLNKMYNGPIEVFKDALEIGTSLTTDALKNMEQTFKVSGLKALALAPFLSDSQKSTLGVFAGVVSNPHTNLIFEGVNLKSHSFTWRLSPRSLQESNALKQIVDELKMRSHPEEAFGGFALDYPDLVYVSFTGPTANYLPKIHKAMITGVQVNTGSGNGLAFYSSGAPTEHEINISMTEINIITRKTLREDLGISEDQDPQPSPEPQPSPGPIDEVVT